MEDENIPEFLNLIYFEQFSSIVVIADLRCASTYVFFFRKRCCVGKYFSTAIKKLDQVQKIKFP